jgi:hypothetical protein
MTGIGAENPGLIACWALACHGRRQASGGKVPPFLLHRNINLFRLCVCGGSRCDCHHAHPAAGRIRQCEHNFGEPLEGGPVRSAEVGENGRARGVSRCRGRRATVAPLRSAERRRPRRQAAVIAARRPLGSTNGLLGHARAPSDPGTLRVTNCKALMRLAAERSIQPFEPIDAGSPRVHHRSCPIRPISGPGIAIPP